MSGSWIVSPTDGYGSAEIRRHDDGRLEVVRADDVIGITSELVFDVDASLWVDSDGLLLLAGDPRYRYRPVRFANAPGLTFPTRGVQVVVCERVVSGG